jgi:hypothetical protein
MPAKKQDMKLQKKKIFWLLIIACCLFGKPAASQVHLQLILKTDKPIDSAIIVQWNFKKALWLPYKDTIEVDFETKGINYYHLNYKIANGKNYFVPLYLDTGNIQVVTHIENEKLTVDRVTGSAMYEKYTRWRTRYDDLKSDKDSVGLDAFLLKSYEENIDNLFSFQIGNRYLDIHQSDKVKLYALLPLIAKQTDELKSQFGFSLMNDWLQGIIKNDFVNLSDWPLIGQDNKITHASAPDAKFVILDFWFVGCVPCMEDHVKMIKLIPLLKQKRTEFISISNDESYKKWKNYLDKHLYKWQHYKKNDDANNIIDQLGISTYPTYILLNEKGKILFSSYSLEEILRQLNE